MFWREQANKTYNPLAWYFAKILSELPMYTVFVVVVSIVTYFIVELSIETGEQFLIYLLILWLLMVRS
jgi:ABC-type multidrug transport system permease subunit